MEDVSVTTDNWKGQLNFEMTCSSAGPLDRCGLISELTPWNRVLYGLNYELAETSPGKLSLRYMEYSAVHERPRAAAPQAAFLISWLIEHHRCIDELCISCSAGLHCATSGQTVATIRLRPPSGKSIRRLDLKVCPPFRTRRLSFCCLQEDDVESLRGIEELRVRCCDSKFEPLLVRLLRNNSNSLKHVEVIERVLSLHVANALQCLEECESLSVLLCLNHLQRIHWDIRVMNRLLRSLPHVKRLSFLSTTCSESTVSAVADFLNSNSNLTELELHLYGRTSVEEFYTALEVNATLKTLFIALKSYDTSSKRSLVSALSKNSALINLHLGGGNVTEDYMLGLARALSRNRTLETLQFPCVPSVKGVLAMCDALKTNTTLKKLMFPPFHASQEERAVLAEKLAHGQGYSRVQLTHLSEPDLPTLSSCLSSPALCPQFLGKIDTRDIADATLKVLLDAIATSSSVLSLALVVGGGPPEKTTALCRALRENRSIRGITVQMKRGHGLFLRELLNVFEANRRINEAEIFIDELDAEAASILSDFFAANKTITMFRLFITGDNYDRSLERFNEEVSRGMVMNPVVIEFQAGRLRGFEYPNYKVSDALRRNWSTLNRAVDFVLLCDKDRMGAEAFELFSGRSCLLARVMKTAGKIELDARQAIASAENYVRDNYFVITGVVRSSVVCHPVDGGTQWDDLNCDCWRAIMRYLNVSDVLG